MRGWICAARSEEEPERLPPHGAESGKSLAEARCADLQGIVAHTQSSQPKLAVVIPFLPDDDRSPGSAPDRVGAIQSGENGAGIGIGIAVQLYHL